MDRTIVKMTTLEEQDEAFCLSLTINEVQRLYKPHELLDESNFPQSLFGTCPFQFLVSDANLKQAQKDFMVKVSDPQRHSALSELAKAIDPTIKAASLAILAKVIS